MKKLILGLFLLCGSSSFAQTNVSVTIDHLLNGEELAWNVQGVNNLDAEFTFNRLEYYLSGFKVTHDGGNVTTYDDVYALVQGDESPTIDLGELFAENIEMISFSVGVDPGNNNGDPSAWPPAHPLAPKNPSMHWGWISGYRFVAVEGDIVSTSQEYSIHGLGNVNYFEVSLEVNMPANEDDVNIYLKADTENFLYNMNLDGTVFSHGEEGLALETLINMSERVFSITSAPLSTEDENELLKFNLFPNPTDNGSVQLNFATDAGDFYNLVVRDIQGKIVLQRNQVNSGYQLDVNGLHEGLYLVSLYNDTELRAIKKLVVRKN
ncbi:T9SS type A sorting domain-containing protein [Cryomorphaceae bacterium 1068]|nr:T9SS type A sorting domain-containing protein [Cryomorphaceae bacterium 1068]